MQNLLTEKDGKISGPMSPFEFAKEMALAADFKFNRLARVWFNDEEIFQVYEGDGLTGHDTLIIACEFSNDLELTLWVDTGVGGVPVAQGFNSDRKILLTPIYRRTEFARNLTEAEIHDIFEYIFDNPHVLGIQNGPKPG